MAAGSNVGKKAALSKKERLSGKRCSPLDKK